MHTVEKMDGRKLRSVAIINSNSQAKLVELDNLDLPFEIITTILLFLPPKSLAKFMCVAKAWKNWITNPIFVYQHLQKSASKGEEGFILYMTMHHEENISFNLLNDRSFEEDSRFSIPFLPRLLMIVGCFSGLLCLAETDYFGSKIYLCNPSIRKYKVIPSSTFDIQSTTDIVLGFGYQAVTKDYKVIRIAYRKFDHSDDKSKDNYRTKVEVYSLSTNSWKEIETISFPWYIFEMSSEVVLNESVHWVAMEWGITREDLVILSFDLGKEAFKQISLPVYNQDEDTELVEFLGVLKESLSLFVYCPIKDSQRAKYCDLWVMKEYGKVDSWTKLCTITVEGRVARPLKFTNHGYIILCDGAKHVFVYNVDNPSFKDLGILGSNCSFVTYTNSLILIDEINEPRHPE